LEVERLKAFDLFCL